MRDVLQGCAFGCGCVLWYIAVVILAWVVAIIIFPDLTGQLLWSFLLR